MDQIKKAYVDSRFRTRDSVSDSGLKMEYKEPLDLPDNTFCYIDDISIPHTWRTVDSHNNKLHNTNLFSNICISLAVVMK